MIIHVIALKIDNYELREDLYYWPRRLTWGKVEPNNKVRVGITDLAQGLAGKIRFIRIKPKGVAVEQGASVGTIETGKWVGPVETPVSGTIEEVNQALRAKPALLNEQPYDDGWIAVIKMTKPDETAGLKHGDDAAVWYKAEIETRTKDKKQ